MIIRHLTQPFQGNCNVWLTTITLLLYNPNCPMGSFHRKKYALSLRIYPWLWTFHLKRKFKGSSVLVLVGFPLYHLNSSSGSLGRSSTWKFARSGNARLDSLGSQLPVFAHFLPGFLTCQRRIAPLFTNTWIQIPNTKYSPLLSCLFAFSSPILCFFTGSFFALLMLSGSDSIFFISVSPLQC